MCRQHPAKGFTSSTAVSAFVALVAAISSACAAFAPRPSGTSSQTIRTWNETHQRTDLGSPTLEVTAAPDGSRVVVTADRAQTCVTTDIEHEEFRTIEQTDVPWAATGTALAIAAIGTGVGAYFSGTASGRPDTDDPNSRGELSKQGALKIGLPFLVVGLGAAGLGGYSIFQARDKVSEPQTMQHPPKQYSKACGVRRDVGSVVTLKIWDGTVVTGPTDSVGQAFFSIAPDQRRLPPRSDQPWSLVEASYGNVTAFTPPAAAFVAAVRGSRLRMQWEAFKARFSATPEWAALQPHYEQVVASSLADEAKRKQEQRQMADESERAHAIAAAAEHLAVAVNRYGYCTECQADVVDLLERDVLDLRRLNEVALADKVDRRIAELNRMRPVVDTEDADHVIVREHGAVWMILKDSPETIKDLARYMGRSRVSTARGLAAVGCGVFADKVNATGVREVKIAVPQNADASEYIVLVGAPSMVRRLCATRDPDTLAQTMARVVRRTELPARFDFKPSTNTFPCEGLRGICQGVLPSRRATATGADCAVLRSGNQAMCRQVLDRLMGEPP